jgi:hypothetical protein
MALKDNWANGNYVYAADLNEIASTVNNVAVIAATTVKTANFSASAGTLVPCNATGGAFTVTLPSAPTDDSRVSVKKIDSSANAVTVACSGSDRFNAPGGNTTLILDTQNQVITVQYDSFLAVWYTVSSDVPTSLFGKNLLSVADASAGRTLLGTISSDDSRLTNTRTPTDNTVTSAKLDSTFLSTLATKTGTETLTGKTLTGPRINTVNDTNGNAILSLSATTSATNYVQLANAATGGTPGLSAISTPDANVSISLSPKGTGSVVVGGSTPTITSTGTNANLNLASQGTGTVRANGVEVATISGTQTLTGKTISGSSNTFSNIAQASVTNLTTSLSGKADVITNGSGKLLSGAQIDLNPASTAFSTIFPAVNDLSFATLRGGTVTFTRNGTTINPTSVSHLFDPDFNGPSAITVVNGDTVVMEVTYPVSVTSLSGPVVGMISSVSARANNVTIEVYSGTTWTTVATITNDTTGRAWAKATGITTTTITKLRFTCTNFATTTFVPVFVFAVDPSTKGVGSAFLPRNGGEIYGSSTVPVTFTATGSDSNIGINLVSKGTAKVQANGVEVVTVSSTQTLSNKTITGYVPLNGSNQIASQYLPTSGYSVNIGNGSATTFNVVHGLNTLDVVIGVYDSATGAEVNCDKIRSSSGSVTLTFAAAPANNAYRVTVLSSGGVGQPGGTIVQSSWTTSRINSATLLNSAAGNTYIILLESGSAAPQLPTAIGNSSRYVIKNIHGSANCTITTSAAQTIEGQANLVLSAGASVELVSDNTNWRII